MQAGGAGREQRLRDVFGGPLSFVGAESEPHRAFGDLVEEQHHVET